jgi:hypothetical protein
VPLELLARHGRGRFPSLLLLPVTVSVCVSVSAGQPTVLVTEPRTVLVRRPRIVLVRQRSAVPVASLSEVVARTR